MSNAGATVEVSCPKCGTQLAVPSQFVGKKGRCTGCQDVFVIMPKAAAAPASSPFSQPSSLPPVRTPAPQSGMPPSSLTPLGSTPQLGGNGSLFDDDDFKLAPLPSAPVSSLPPSQYGQTSNPYSAPAPSQFYDGGYSPENQHGGIQWGTVGGGVATMTIAVVWFVGAYMLANLIFIYPPILFIFGLIAAVKGLMGSSE